MPPWENVKLSKGYVCQMSTRTYLCTKPVHKIRGIYRTRGNPISSILVDQARKGLVSLLSQGRSWQTEVYSTKTVFLDRLFGGFSIRSFLVIVYNFLPRQEH